MRRKTVYLLGTLLMAGLMASVVFMPHPGRESAHDDQDIVVLLHGLARGNAVMWLMAVRLEDAGFHVHRVGYSSLNRSPEQMLEEVQSQIDECCAAHPRRVHFVGHSMGGLLIRAYLEDKPVENLGRVVLIGTPNQGTEVVDRFRDRWWMQMLGPAALSLGTDDESFPKSLAAPYYPVGVIAGESRLDIDDEILPGKDDGLVPVEATKLEGMSDFIVVESGHALMRYDEEVARQTIAFLNDGEFLRDVE